MNDDEMMKECKKGQTLFVFAELSGEREYKGILKIDEKKKSYLLKFSSQQTTTEILIRSLSHKKRSEVEEMLTRALDCKVQW